MKTHQLCWELEAKEGLPGEVRRPDAAPNVTALSFEISMIVNENDLSVVLEDAKVIDKYLRRWARHSKKSHK